MASQLRITPISKNSSQEESYTSTEREKMYQVVGSYEEDIQFNVRLVPVGTCHQLFFIRTAESLDDVFPRWRYSTTKFDYYERNNLNQPQSLPEREGGIRAFQGDPPVTEIGKICANTLALSIKHLITKSAVIYSSPRLSSIQTAKEITKELTLSDDKIKVEYGLIEWKDSNSPLPKWMTPDEFAAMGIYLDRAYNALITPEQIQEIMTENRYAFLQRCQDVLARIISTGSSTALVVLDETNFKAMMYLMRAKELNISDVQPTFEFHRKSVCSRYSVAIFDQDAKTLQWKYQNLGQCFSVF